MTTMPKAGLALRAYLAATHLIPLVAGPVLARRRKRGKEHETRWVEKQGRGLAARPDGRLIWINAVGLGEILSLRGLIARMAAAAPDLHFLVTSTTAASARVFTAQMPPSTIHQFLPLDAPAYRRRFLDHVRPDLCIWAEQDLWPGLVFEADTRGIPQAMVAARMNAASFARHGKAAGLYRDLYARMALVTAQDDESAAHLSALGAAARVSGSLKPAAPALDCDPSALRELQAATGTRFVWALAPSHAADEAAALAAHQALRMQMPDALLIIAPRHPDRRDAISAACPAPPPCKSQGALPGKDDPVWLCDTLGDLGLVYRVASAVLIGGTFDTTEGHNPWEAAQLDCAVLHGPRVGNFTADFAALDTAGGAVAVQDAAAIANALRDHLAAVAAKAKATAQDAGRATDELARDLLALVKVRHD
ncbi:MULTISPECIES: 3-deoxy-D-manno-octulosonic acid transferase [unclassified Yoonia]|uniref:3-deoxy-D-manno-octulosonic acid transferase n=1 Tax=unclassified Yoonia TaxID=2629118 RepID=UPI002AFF23A8|nr:MULTISPECIES: glycosyltransferase N-terminal domain-containing protein [unclassified Yoonia]